MKIGILTFHRAENFGAVLQAFALQTFLKQLGWNSQIIDYRCKSIEEQYHVFNPSILVKRKNVLASLKVYFSRLKNFRERYRKKKQYQQFRDKHLNISSPVYNNSRLVYDAYITGSDQVWNSYLTGGYDDFYFLRKDFMKTAKRLSYAASCESYNYKAFAENERNVLNFLLNIDGISVREASFAEILRPLIEKVDVNIDPSFLLSSKDYLKIAVAPKEENYIVVYHLVDSDEGSKIASTLADDGQKIVEIHAGYNSSYKKGHLYSLGPTELLGYIAYADAVVTTSFHGLALSLIFHKKVIVVNARNNTRLKSLLERLNLGHLLVSDKNHLPTQTIDYAKVDEILLMEREKSVAYLKDHLVV